MTVIDDFVVLVDRDGNAIGEQRKSLVHTAFTPLHLAFSVYLFDDAGRVLFTRRALSKLTWPGVWTNSCCGHPRLDEDLSHAVGRRTHAELGLQLTDLTCVLPDFSYQARDASGICENEICPVFAARAVQPVRDLRPNADEVMEWQWVEWPKLVQAVAAAPFAFSPWSVTQVSQLSQAGDRLLPFTGLR